MNIKVNNLVKKRYCEDRHIVDSRIKASLNFELVSVNSKGNTVFLVSQLNKDSVYYEVIKTDLAGLDKLPMLSVPKQYRNDFDVNHSRAMMADWIYRKTGHELVEEDVARLVSSKDYITVIIAPDSMRYKSSFQLIRL